MYYRGVYHKYICLSKTDTLTAEGETTQLTVIAAYPDGSTQDIGSVVNRRHQECSFFSEPCP
ncbi:MAG: hypothetical protein ACE5EA_08275 [Nitrospirota bacterium]